MAIIIEKQIALLQTMREMAVKKHEIELLRIDAEIERLQAKAANSA